MDPQKSSFIGEGVQIAKWGFLSDLKEKTMLEYSLRKPSQVCFCLLYTQVKYGFRSPKFICAQLYSLAENSQPPPPAFGHIYEGAIGQPR
jgi:hypothetical protein